MRVSPDETTLQQIVNEYRDMPGLCLTPQQAAHLWRHTPERAAALLDQLVGQQFLRRTPQGAYARRTFDDLPADR